MHSGVRETHDLRTVGLVLVAFAVVAMISVACLEYVRPPPLWLLILIGFFAVACNGAMWFVVRTFLRMARGGHVRYEPSHILVYALAMLLTSPVWLLPEDGHAWQSVGEAASGLFMAEILTVTGALFFYAWLQLRKLPRDADTSPDPPDDE